MPRTKMKSAILNANGGLDSIKALNSARNILLNHDLKQPVLYHLVFTGSQSIPTYQAVIKSLVRRLRSRCRTEYFGAYEVEPEEGKGLHAHCFFVIETSKKTPFKILNVNDGEYLHKLAIRHKLENPDGSTRRIHVSKPKNSMHDGQFFARPVGDKLEDCLNWCTYEYKSRSKEGVPSLETYFNSEFKSNVAKRAAKKAIAIGSSTAALPAAKEVAPVEPAFNPKQDEAFPMPRLTTGQDKTNEGEEMSDQLKAAAFKYLGGLYKHCVDAGMNVKEIQAHLASKGVNRSLFQVKQELTHEFGFPGYVEAHPAPARVNLAEFDKAIDRMTGRELRLHMSQPNYERMYI